MLRQADTDDERNHLNLHRVTTQSLYRAPVRIQLSLTNNLRQLAELALSTSHASVANNCTH